MKVPQTSSKARRTPGRRQRIQVSSPTRSILSADQKTISVRVPLKISQHGGRKLIMTPDGAHSLAPEVHTVSNARIKAVARAFRWRKLLENGAFSSIEEIAASEKINQSYVSRILRLTLLAPDIVERLIDGKRPLDVEFDLLLKPMPTDWQEQRDMIWRKEVR